MCDYDHETASGVTRQDRILSVMLGIMADDLGKIVIQLQDEVAPRSFTVNLTDVVAAAVGFINHKITIAEFRAVLRANLLWPHEVARETMKDIERVLKERGKYVGP